MHTRAEIMTAAAAWVWFPRDGESVTTDLQLVRHPSRLGGGVHGSQVAVGVEAAVILDRAAEQVEAWGESELTIRFDAADRPDLESLLLSRGADHTDTVTVFARSIDEIDIEVPPGVTAEVVRTVDQLREVDAIDVAVWGQHPLDEQSLQTEFAETAQALADGTGVRVLARVGERPVSTGGSTIVGDFARLWGAGTREDARGQGAYRAVLAERLRASAELGATTALVKGRVSTSAPILARVGFRECGEERAYRLSL